MKIEKIKYILLSIAYIALAGLCINIANVLTIVIGNNDKILINLWLFVIFGSIGFIVIPYKVTSKYLINDLGKKLKYRKINIIIDLIIILISSFTFFSFFDSMHNLIVAICEECLFRFIIFNVLEIGYSKWISIIIGSLLFAIALHLNINLGLDFLTKFPAGIILYLVYDKWGIQDSILGHWLYNCLVSLL